ncbi:hypothetical protein 32HC_5 [Mycobacterium phage 32HC]|uniref:Uncharacterized protein n=1 Tax=Mycobacterium phage 32HC TaxID=1445729 RepID=W8EAC9_9CAUD|nr:hypothetical protein ST32HC_5 [Mycobacterium phage 32HC]AHJ86283.1 hypothetical protein 32HC_5 [Mycobacterium phage 32HC]
MGYNVKPEHYVTCMCGKVCKGHAAHSNHAKKCELEIAFTAYYVAAIESDQRPMSRADWLAQRSAP